MFFAFARFYTFKTLVYRLPHITKHLVACFKPVKSQDIEACDADGSPVPSSILAFSDVQECFLTLLVSAPQHWIFRVLKSKDRPFELYVPKYMFPLESISEEYRPFQASIK